MFKKPEMKPSLCLQTTLWFPASETLKIDLIGMEECHNRIYPSIILILRMRLMRREEEEEETRRAEGGAVASAVLALDSVLAPPRAANLSIFNQLPSSLLIFCFLSPAGLLLLCHSFFPLLCHLANPPAPQMLLPTSFFQASISMEMSRPSMENGAQFG